MPELEIRPLRPDEVDRFVELSYYAFNGRVPGERAADFGRRITPERNCLVAVEQAQIVSQVMIYDFEIWIDGVRYPTGGLANVATVPEQARHGHASRLLRATLAWMRDELGQCLSTLYPTMLPLYRGLGWALADDSLTLSGEPTAFRPSRGLPMDDGARIEHHAARVDDIEQLAPLYRRFAEERTGYLDRPRWYWEDMVLRVNRPEPRWVATWRGSDGTLAGYVVYSLEKSPEISLSAYEVVAVRPEAYAGLLTYLSAHHLWNKVVIHAGRDVPWRSLIANPQLLDINVRDRANFMLRIVDLPAAFSRRASPADAGSVVLEVRDEAAPWNAGRWRLSPRDGHWSVEPAGDAAPDAAADIENLSALFAGFLPIPQALEVGALRADERSRPVLEVLFATRFPPTSRDHF